MSKINWKTVEEIENEKATQPKNEIAILKDENAKLNLQIIDLWENLINGGIL